MTIRGTRYWWNIYLVGPRHWKPEPWRFRTPTFNSWHVGPIIIHRHLRPPFWPAK